MLVISSQRYLNEEIVEQKMEELKGLTSLTIGVIDVEMEDDGEALFLLFDKHHTYEACKRLGIEVEFEEVENIFSVTGDELLMQAHYGDDYYNVITGIGIW